jgi:hypothetical protein
MPRRAPAEPQAKTIPLMAIEPMILFLSSPGRAGRASGLPGRTAAPRARRTGASQRRPARRVQRARDAPCPWPSIAPWRPLPPSARAPGPPALITRRAQSDLAQPLRLSQNGGAPASKHRPCSLWVAASLEAGSRTIAAAPGRSDPRGPRHSTSLLDFHRGGQRSRPGQSQRHCALRSDRPKRFSSIEPGCFQTPDWGHQDARACATARKGLAHSQDEPKRSSIDIVSPRRNGWTAGILVRCQAADAHRCWSFADPFYVRVPGSMISR